MQIKKFLDKKTSKKTKIEILEKMLKACEAAGGKLPVTDARKIIIKHAEKRNKFQASSSNATRHNLFTEIEEASRKRQATSSKLDKKK